jgi:hypothetical protein
MRYKLGLNTKFIFYRKKTYLYFYCRNMPNST